MEDKSMAGRGNWYVKLQEAEYALLKTPAQLCVYLAIKSHCGNGKLERDLSIREIASRAKLTKSSIAKPIEELCEIGLIEIKGEISRVGGKSPIYKCPIAGQLSVLKQDTKAQESVLNQEKSVQIQDESVPIASSNNAQTNKQTTQSAVDELISLIPHEVKEENGKFFIKTKSGWKKINSPIAYLNSIKKSSAQIENITPGEYQLSNGNWLIVDMGGSQKEITHEQYMGGTQ